jgi:hypothetical protein
MEFDLMKIFAPIRRRLCRLGWHHWHQDRPLCLYDGFPSPWVGYRSPNRFCVHCGKARFWLPSYQVNKKEFGRWKTKKKE